MKRENVQGKGRGAPNRITLARKQEVGRSGSPIPLRKLDRERTERMDEQDERAAVEDPSQQLNDDGLGRVQGLGVTERKIAKAKVNGRGGFGRRSVSAWARFHERQTKAQMIERGEIRRRLVHLIEGRNRSSQDGSRARDGQHERDVEMGPDGNSDEAKGLARLPVKLWQDFERVCTVVKGVVAFFGDMASIVQLIRDLKNRN